MVLTVSRGNMSNVVFGAVCGHHISKLAGKISGSMPLEQVVQQDGVVCSVCVRHKTKLSDTLQVHSPGPGMSSSSSLLLL
jgi:hypothetical protein